MLMLFQTKAFVILCPITKHIQRSRIIQVKEANADALESFVSRHRRKIFLMLFFQNGTGGALNDFQM